MRRSKYNFASLELNGELKVKGIDVYSVKNALAGYNKRAGKKIAIELQNSDADINGEHTFKRTS